MYECLYDTNRMTMASNVSILHCGSKSEINFIQYLEKCNIVCKDPSLRFEYTNYREHQANERIILSDAIRYKKQKSALLVLISHTFFELLWPTSHKLPILNIISNYSHKNCIHIWLDVIEDNVKRYSKELLRIDGYFRRIHAKELYKLHDADVTTYLHKCIYMHPTSTYHQENYGIDDEIDEMKKKFYIKM